MLNNELLKDYMGDVICQIRANNDCVYYGKIVEVNDGWIKVEGDRGSRLLNGEIIKEIRVASVQIPQSDNTLLRYWQLFVFFFKSRKNKCKKAD